jgi:hypothetical protein
LLLKTRYGAIKSANWTPPDYEAAAHVKRKDAPGVPRVCGADGDRGVGEGLDARSAGSIRFDAARLPAVALLYEEGPTRMTEAANRMRFKRQTLDPVVGGGEKSGE